MGDAVLSLLVELGQQLEKRIGAVPAVPKDFKPLKASPQELRKLGYPSRPPKHNAVALDIWTRMVSAPWPADDWQKPMLPLLAGPFTCCSTFNNTGFRGRDETSENWSGVVTQSADAPPFRTVFGLWQVPEVKAPTGAAEGEVYACSTWIGFDGYKPTSASLPQIGTTQAVRIVEGAPVASYETWWQWWLRDAPTVPVPISASIPVDKGDTIACSVEIAGADSVVFGMANLSRPDLPLLRLPVSQPPIGGRYGTHLWSTAGTTAEWILERPRDVSPPQDLYRLPVLDTVTFTGSAVSDSPARRDFRPVRVLRMIENLATECAVISRADTPGPPGIAIVGPGVERRMGG